MSNFGETSFVILLAIAIVLGIYLFSSSVKIAKYQDIYVYFIKKNSEEIIAIKRDFPDRSQIEEKALNNLLEGPTAGEQSELFTAINPDVEIQSFRIENKVAYADFNEELEREVAGSARVLAIREQIEKTLKQFDTIKEVVISIDGRIDGILQP